MDKWPSVQSWRFFHFRSLIQWGMFCKDRLSFIKMRKLTLFQKLLCVPQRFQGQSFSWLGHWVMFPDSSHLWCLTWTSTNIATYRQKCCEGLLFRNKIRAKIGLRTDHSGYLTLTNVWAPCLYALVIFSSFLIIKNCLEITAEVWLLNHYAKETTFFPG